MTALVLSMLRARWTNAVTLFLLASVAVAAAVAGPVSKRATDAAVVSVEVAHASGRERSISVVWFTDPTTAQGSARFDAVTGVVSLPGFDVIRAGELTTFGPGPDLASARLLTGTRVVFRDALCEHVTILSGRCLVGTDEIVIGERTASHQGLTAGEVATIQASRLLDDGTLVPDGDPARLTVVGIYRPVDVDDAYWAGRGYFRVTADGTRAEAVFTTAPSMEHVPHTVGASYVDVIIPPHVLTAQRLAGIEAEIDEVNATLSRLGNVANSDVPDLAQRVAASGELAGQLGAVAFLPLAAISLFVIYLAVGYGVSGSRGEIALVALRGVATSRRWLVASGETVLPILVAAPVGYALGHVGVWIVARLRLGSGEGAHLSVLSLPYAAVALIIALGVALLGQRRALREPVVDLLRGVPRAASVWQALTIEVLVGALAVVATLQLRSSPEGITGLGILVPGLLMVAVALVAARAFIPLAALVARAALRRGLLGAGLAAVQLARRPGSQRLFVLLAVGVSMLSFVAAGTDVAARARDERATVQAGAYRVLHVVGADARDLLAATQGLDPDGAWAMAAMTLDPLTPDDPTVLAVDASRLATVASWRPEFGTDVATVAAAIAAPEPGSPGYLAPLEFHGTALEFDAEVDSVGQLGVEFEFVRLTDGDPVAVVLPDLGPGRQTVRAGNHGCEDGCRLVSFRVRNARPGANLILHALRQLNPPADVVSSAEFGSRERWRTSEGTGLVASGSVLVVRMNRITDMVQVGVLDALTPVPVAAVGDEVARVVSLDRQYVDSDQVQPLSMLPRLGQQGVLVDMRYLERTLIGAPLRDNGEIWLGPAAPATAAEQFRERGLAVVEETGVAAARDALARQGPALALQFYVAAAVLGVLLALGGLGLAAAVDRRSRAADLRALRVQGLRRRMVRRATLWGYLSTVVLAAVAGLGGAAVAWVAAGDRLPVFVDASSVLTPSPWPQWLAVARPWLVATAAMTLAAVVASWALRRAVARPNGNGGPR